MTDPVVNPDAVLDAPLGAPAADVPGAGDAGPASKLEELVTNRPEALAGAAFAGGVVLAMIVRRLGR